MAHSGFKASWPGQSGCFRCELCGRKTRGVGQMSSHLCGPCDEWTMTMNTLNDDGLGMPVAERQAMVEYVLKNKVEAAKRGGDLSKLQLGKDEQGAWVDLGGPWPWERDLSCAGMLG